MSLQVSQTVKYRLKSFAYDCSAQRRVVFSIEEIGVAGELRQYADEILANFNWQQEFSITDVAVVLYIRDNIESEVRFQELLGDHLQLKFA